MKNLTEILKDLEQGKISADNAEIQVLRLFDVSGQVCDVHIWLLANGMQDGWNRCVKCGYEKQTLR